MKIIGLTGKTGAGKSSVGALLAAHGIPVIDCDRVARGVTEMLLPELEAAFPGVVRRGELDRAALAKSAFGSPEATETLNRITHPAVLREVERRITALAAEPEPPDAVAVDGAALIESGFDARCDLLVVVTAPEELRLARLLARDNHGEAELRRRMSAQQEDNFYTGHADFVIENSGESAALRRAVEELLARLKSAEKGKNKG